MLSSISGQASRCLFYMPESFWDRMVNPGKEVTHG
jgi:hypothetical protein